MDFLSPVITFLSNLIGNFGWAIVLAVAVCHLITVPFKLMSKKNSKAKKACEPEIIAIRKKYNANAMGVSMDDPDDLSPEIKKMSKDERDEAMANEIAATYKKHGYKLWTGWMPGLLTLLFIIFLYGGIRAATPDGFYAETFKDMQAGGDWMAFPNHMMVLGSLLLMSCVSNLYSMIKKLVSCKKTGAPLSPVLIASLISLAVSLGFSIWIASGVTMATAIAILTLQMLSFIEGIITDICSPKPAESVQMS